MDTVAKIAHKIKTAENGKRVATIHYQALKNAKELEGIDLDIFCKEANIAKSYGTEIRKMISLHKFMSEIGAKITS
ncbi:MAG: hypothetical protein KGI29_03845 [Pseudomonadota bacterium]|nr:hypothetical protein [Pseudomonadota bacterium]MDE3037197.1 hypothetical protein [Pseudomonadota bacterium]